MTDSLLHDFIKLVAMRTGLCTREKDQPAFRNKLLERIRSFHGSPLDYYQQLTLDTPQSHREWNLLTELLTTGESYFFRDRNQFQLLRNQILPELIERRSQQRQLRIWSAGCSSGEEPYSLAIVLHELLPRRKEWQIFVLGTDLQEQAVQQARKGLYTPWSFRMVDPALKSRYFSPQHEYWKIDDAIRSMVTFSSCNLVKERFPDCSRELHDMDLIICRNVFIYFTPQAVSQVAGKFSETLNEGGYLMTGHGELHLQSVQHLKTKMCGEQVIFQKRSATRDGGTLADTTRGTSPLPARSTGKQVAAPPPDKPRNIPVIAKHAQRMAHEQGATAATWVAALPDNKTVPHNFEAYLTMAQRQADQGEYQQALKTCRQAITLEATSPHPYFLLAQIAEATGDVDNAKDLLKKTIYLDPLHVAAHLELGALYAQEHNQKLAEKFLSASSQLLQQLPSGTSLPPYHNMTAGELLRHTDELLTGLNTKEAPRGNNR